MGVNENWEVGEEKRSRTDVKMIFAQAEGEDLTYSVSGLYRGAEHDYPPGTRRYSPCR